MNQTRDDITTHKAAELLGVSPQTVRRLILAGELPSWKKIADFENAPFTGPRAEVLAYLKRRESKKSQ